MTDIIKHQGIIVHIEKAQVQVKIVQTSACSSCDAKHLCNSSESKEKIIHVHDTDTSDLYLGQEVMVCGTMSMGIRAVILAFVIPLILLTVSLFLSYTMTERNDVISSACALGVVCVYYFIIYLLRDRIKRDFVFTIEHK